jgi:IMP dehydrogenase
MTDQYKIIEKENLTFDDVLLVPNFAGFKRDEIEIDVDLGKGIKLGIPFISSPMDTVTDMRFAIAIGRLGGLGIIHRNLSVEEQLAMVKEVKKQKLIAAAAVGAGGDLEIRVDELLKAQIDVLVVDSAHGYSKSVIETTKYIAKKSAKVLLISGNVATQAGAKALFDAGADLLRVGMGPGSICSTRIVAGIGVPQLSALIDCAQVAKQYKKNIIADGGMRYSGDVVKAIGAGAIAVMSGSLFAGTIESPGKLITIKNKKYKLYRGMGSISAMKDGSAARYDQNYRKGQQKKLIAEGVEGIVDYKGNLEDVLAQLTGGLKSGMYYTGARTINELSEKTRFIRITNSALQENHPHDIKIINN